VPKTNIGVTTVSSTNDVGKLDIYMEHTETYLCLSPSTKINSKWIKDLHVIHKTLKRLKENIQRTLENIGIGNAFLNRTLIAHEIRVRIDKCD
jgi:hypothetical protein